MCRLFFSVTNCGYCVLCLLRRRFVFNVSYLLLQQRIVFVSYALLGDNLFLIFALSVGAVTNCVLYNICSSDEFFSCLPYVLLQ